MWLRPKGRGAAARMDVRRLPLSAESASMSLGHFLQVCLWVRFVCVYVCVSVCARVHVWV